MGFVFLAPPGLELPMCHMEHHGGSLGPFDGDTFSKEESKYSLFLNLPFNFDIEIYASEDSGINRRYCNG